MVILVAFTAPAAETLNAEPRPIPVAPMNIPEFASLYAVFDPFVRFVPIVNPPMVPAFAVISPVIFAALAVICPSVLTENAPLFIFKDPPVIVKLDAFTAPAAETLNAEPRPMPVAPMNIPEFPSL